jgi:phosphatidate cytidylyltransferase
MTKRLIAALVPLPYLFLALYFAPTWVLAASLSAVAALAAYELLHATGLVKSLPLLIVALTAAAAVPWTYLDGGGTLIFLAVIAVVTAEFIVAMGSRGTIHFDALSGVFFAAVCIPLLSASLLRIYAARITAYT